jgi:hypothetical protein
MRWTVVLAASLLACSCGKRPVEISGLARSKAHGGMNAATWTDRNGENRAVFSVVDTREPDDEETPGGTTRRAKVELSAGGKLLQTWTVDVPGCEFDQVGGFADAALGLTDLDGDGVGELSFANASGCVSGLQPYTLTVVMLEGRDRYVLTGTTHIDYGGGEVEGGGFEPDAAMKKSPFLPHAESLWAKIVEQKNWE